MKRKDVRALLDALVKKISAEPWSVDKIMKLPRAEQITCQSEELCLEIDLLEKDQGEYNIAVSLSGSSLFQSMFPVTSGFYLREEDLVLEEREKL